MTGQVGNGISNKYVLARRSTFSTANPAPQAGRYTLLFSEGYRPPGNSELSYGLGTLLVDASGNTHFSGKLVDGTRFTQGGTISDFGEWPFYASLPGGTDYLSGWILFTNAPNTSLGGHIYWIKPGESNYPTEFLTPLDVFGSKNRSADEMPPAVQP